MNVFDFLLIFNAFRSHGKRSPRGYAIKIVIKLLKHLLWNCYENGYTDLFFVSLLWFLSRCKQVQRPVGSTSPQHCTTADCRLIGRTVALMTRRERKWECTVWCGLDSSAQCTRSAVRCGAARSRQLVNCRWRTPEGRSSSPRMRRRSVLERHCCHSSQLANFNYIVYRRGYDI